MIDVKEAAKTAAEYFADIYADQQFSDILFEEFDFDHDKNVWLVTLGYSRLDTKTAMAAALGTKEREYKVFEIDAKTGKVYSMKIRTSEHA